MSSFVCRRSPSSNSRRASARLAARSLSARKVSTANSATMAAKTRAKVATKAPADAATDPERGAASVMLDRGRARTLDAVGLEHVLQRHHPEQVADIGPAHDRQHRTAQRTHPLER